MKKKNKMVYVIILVCFAVVAFCIFYFAKSSDIKYKFEYEDETYKAVGIKSLTNLTINGKEVMNKENNLEFTNIEINKQKDFVIINFICDYPDYTKAYLKVYDYEGNDLYYSKENYSNGIDKLAYTGKYEYDSTSKSLTLNYHLVCTSDNNACQKLTNEEVFENGEYVSKAVSCEKINTYRNAISEGIYKTTYIKGKFSDDSLVKYTKITDDDIYSSYFEKCPMSSSKKEIIE